MSRQVLVLFSGLLLLMIPFLLASKSLAVQTEPFTEETFETLQGQGENILVHISAPWCPNCEEQKSILSDYQEQYPDSELHILRVDFDSQKEWVRYFDAPQQSTLVLFSGNERVWFTVAETDRETIFTRLNAVSGNE